MVPIPDFLKYLLVLCLLALLIPSTNAEEIDALSLLKKEVGEAIKAPSNMEIWYCPDNTCDIYKISKANPDFPSFIYLHLFHKSGYIYLNETIGGNKEFRKVAIEEPAIRKSVSGYCPSEPKTPDCILENMEKKLEIKLCSGRYDEGYFCSGCGANENVCEKL